jgi:hypothetical protein
VISAFAIEILSTEERPESEPIADPDPIPAADDPFATIRPPVIVKIETVEKPIGPSSEKP